MRTEHERAAGKLARRLLGTPEGAHSLHLAYKGVSERWEREYVDAIGQHYIYSDRCDWPLEQIACFALVHGYLGNGTVGRVLVRAGGEPGRDSDREHNAGLLAEMPEPFVAELDMSQNCADSDGVLRWTEPIQVHVATTEREDGVGGECAVLAPAVIRPGRVPLEVGSTMPSRTALHLREDRGVAHWPYGSDWIWLLVRMEHLALRPGDSAEFVPARFPAAETA